MNKKLFKFLVLLLFVGSIFCACVSSASRKNVTSVDDVVLEEFYVYDDFASGKGHYFPSGWMGDVVNLKMDLDCKEDPISGQYCIKLKYTAHSKSKQWVGIYWQDPTNNWGDKKGGYDLTGAKTLSFYARGKEGNEVISEVKMGGLSGKYSDSDVAWLKNIKLSTSWKKYTIDISKLDLSRISGGFCIVFSKKENPYGCTVYLDEIKYE